MVKIGVSPRARGLKKVMKDFLQQLQAHGFDNQNRPLAITRLRIKNSVAPAL